MQKYTHNAQQDILITRQEKYAEKKGPLILTALVRAAATEQSSTSSEWLPMAMREEGLSLRGKQPDLRTLKEGEEWADEGSFDAKEILV